MLMFGLSASFSSELSRKFDLPCLVEVYIKMLNCFLLKLYLYHNFFYPKKKNMLAIHIDYTFFSTVIVGGKKPFFICNSL